MTASCPRSGVGRLTAYPVLRMPTSKLMPLEMAANPF
jgi:hypothetical protein